MGSKWVWVLMFVPLAWCLSEGCLDEERVALLQLKHFFNGSRYNYLSDWIDGEKNFNCCQWSRLECSNSTGRVIRLNLGYKRNKNLEEWYLNVSLFSVFEELEWLELYENRIAGFVENEGLSRLSSLKHLDLRFNKFNNDILSSLHALSSLKELYLSDNKLKGIIDLQSLDSSNNLQVLELGSNEIEKIVFHKGLNNLEELDLSHNNLDNSILSSIGALSSLKILYLNDNGLKGIIDISGVVFHNKLQHLTLDNNEVEEVIISKGLDKLPRLSNLEYLSLQSNKLIKNDILSSLDAFPSLKEIILTNNSLKGTIDLGGLGSCNNLQTLWLDSNEIEKIVFHKGLNNLEELGLSSNNLDNRILSSIGALSSLKRLYLNDNGLKGIVDISELYSLNNLERLNLGNNKIDKFIFSKDNTSLRNLGDLSLYNNSIHDGNNLLQLLGSFPSLETLYLGYNNFNETTTIGDFLHLKNTMNLKALYIVDTNLSITFLQIIGLLTSASLEDLILSNCGLHGTISQKDGGTLAEFLYHQHNLQSIDLSSNNLTGEFPSWLLENHSRLYELNLANNSLGGCFQLPTHAHLNLTSLDISKNFFRGPIPKKIGGYLPSLRFLNISKNYFDGSIPSSIGDMSSLDVLDFSYNQMSGEIPKHLVEGCSSLSLLLLSNNRFQGQMFFSNFNLTNLERLQLDGNNFTGKIPDSLSNASNLRGLYLSDNNLSGRLPSWLGNMSGLEDIILPNNHLEGPIPFEFCQLEDLAILNLADNNLSGSLPYCFNFPIIKQIHLSKNSFQGQLSDFLVNSSSLVTLDLSHNQLHGTIPTWMSLNFNLKYLILRNNNLSGELPIQLCHLNQLRMVDLSHNNLSGHIPPCLELTALHDNNNSDVHIDSTYISDFRRDTMIQIRKEETVEFTTKTSSYSYQGKVLTYMSGVDLSCNNLRGSIPQQIGNLTRIRSLNLSYNNLIGSIPLTFSNLKKIESLDLSYNNLNEKIPSQLVELTFLSSFSVAHNNLSGKTLERIAQFATFEENCYVGNPFLCGPPLNKSCEIIGPPSQMPGASIDNKKDSDFIDIETFYMSFMGSYIIVLVGIGAVLYINPYWRRTWFYLIEMWMISFYYFIVDRTSW